MRGNQAIHLHLLVRSRLLPALTAVDHLIGPCLPHHAAFASQPHGSRRSSEPIQPRPRPQRSCRSRCCSSASRPPFPALPPRPLDGCLELSVGDDLPDEGCQIAFATLFDRARGAAGRFPPRRPRHLVISTRRHLELDTETISVLSGMVRGPRAATASSSSTSTTDSARMSPSIASSATRSAVSCSASLRSRARRRRSPSRTLVSPPSLIALTTHPGGMRLLS